MQPLAYVDELNARYQSLGFPPYDWTVNDSAPLARLAKPLAECRVSLLTTGGISLATAAPFDANARNDLRLDAIPADTPADGFQIHDNYYDHRDASRDINCQFPLTRLHELAASGFIGSVASRLWSGFMGRIYIRNEVCEIAAPAFARELAADGVDVLVLIPACPLDHQTAGLVARVVEEHGIVTTLLSTGRDLSWNVRAPRTAFVNHPMGNALGAPNDADGQRAVLAAALELAETVSTGGTLVDLPSAWPRPFAMHFPMKSREDQLKK
ncbi:MAG: selenoprotein B [Gammaproteobacteria bacterium]